MRRLFPHIRSLLSGPSGRISSARTLMLVFSVFSMVILSFIFRHLLTLHGAELQAWLGSLPAIFSGLLGLISVPYAASKASASVSDIISSIRKKD